jgi:SAM-dependent methyltransferase
MPEKFIYTRDDVLQMLDALLADGAIRWDELFAAPAGPCPFLVEWPDENLADWFGDGLLTPGDVLELGCGHGRNATYLADLGCAVDAIDLSAQAIERATRRAEQAGIAVSFRCCSIFDAELREGSYDLIYDSGCFHHLPPHRRLDYVELVARALKPGGNFGLVCFGPRAAAATPTSRSTSGQASAAAWAIQRNACAPYGTSRRSPCARCGRWPSKTTADPITARISYGRSWPQRNHVANPFGPARAPGLG